MKDNTFIFATNNSHKAQEIAAILGESYCIKSLHDLNFTEEIPETATTIEGNALQKAHTVYELFGKDCFADDTALEVEALNGEPGVFSARYAGEEHDSEANMNKLLQKLKGIKNRKAQFRTVIALIINEEEILFEGKITGTIIDDKRGEGGFGYDPIFVPDGYDMTFAQLGSEIKNRISHRSQAIQKLVHYLETDKK